MGCAPSIPQINELDELVSGDTSFPGDAPMIKKNFGKITKLNLAGCMALKGEEPAKKLADSLRFFAVLEEIDLSGCPLGGNGIIELGTALMAGKPAGLKALNLSSTCPTGAATAFGLLVQSLAQGEYKFFSSLDIGGNPIKPNGAIAVAKAIKDWKPPLRELMMADCHIAGSGIQAIASAVQCLPGENSIKLDLFSNHLGESGGQALGEMMGDESAPPVDYLCVQAAVMGSTGTKAMVEAGFARASESLRALDLSGNGIGNNMETEGLAALAASFEAHPPKELHVLNLAENGLNQGGCAQMLMSLKHATALAWLDLSDNDLREPDIEPLVTALPLLTNLETIGINENPKIGDAESAKYAETLKGMPSLTAVHMCNTGVGPLTKTALLALLDLDSIKVVDVRNNSGLTGGAQDELKAAAKPTATLMLPRDEDRMGITGARGLDSRKAWFQWIGSKIFVPKDKSGTSTRDW